MILNKDNSPLTVDFFSRIALLLASSSSSFDLQKIETHATKIPRFLNKLAKIKSMESVFAFGETKKISYHNGLDDASPDKDTLHIKQAIIINHEDDVFPFFSFPSFEDYEDSYTISTFDPLEGLEEACVKFGFTPLFSFDDTFIVPSSNGRDYDGVSSLFFVIQDNETGLVIGSQYIDVENHNSDEIEIDKMNFIYAEPNEKDDLVLDIAGRALRKVLYHGRMEAVDLFFTKFNRWTGLSPLVLLQKTPLPGMLSTLIGHAYHHPMERDFVFEHHPHIHRIETRINPADPTEVAIEIACQKNDRHIVITTSSRVGRLLNKNSVAWFEVSNDGALTPINPNIDSFKDLVKAHSEAYISAQSRYHFTGDLHCLYERNAPSHQQMPAEDAKGVSR